jgi:hypothetical protein
VRRYAALSSPLLNAKDQPSSKQNAAVYKVPEYYQNNKFSFYDMEVALHKFRQQQPSSRAKSAPASKPSQAEQKAAEKK